MAAADVVAPVPRGERDAVRAARPGRTRSHRARQGTRLIGGTIRGELRRDDLDAAAVDGFFPAVSADEMPARRRLVGLQELGLPYAPDPAVTRHLARFLSWQAVGSPASSAVRRGPSGLVCPTHLLFNGGVMKAEALRARIDVLNGWLTREGFAPLDMAHVLDAPDLDHAVARGAACYGRARASGRGVRIRSGASRSYYIGIESALPAVPGFQAPLKALCVVPFGMEEARARRSRDANSDCRSASQRSSVSHVNDPQGRSAGDNHRGLGRRSRRTRSARGDAGGRPEPGLLGRRWGRPRDAREPRH